MITTAPGSGAGSAADAALQVGLVSADCSTLYTLDVAPLLNSNTQYAYCYSALIPDLPEGDYYVAIINNDGGADFEGTLYYNLGGYHATYNNHTYTNTLSEDGTTRADIQFSGNTFTGEIIDVGTVTARSIEGLTNPMCAVTGTSFDDAAKTMTVTCATSGLDAGGVNQQGTATFKIALP